MSVDLDRLKSMREAHASQVSSRGLAISKLGVDLKAGAKSTEKVYSAQEVLALLEIVVPFYRHVGAKWALDTILEGKLYAWSALSPDE